MPNISCFCPDNCLFAEALNADGFAKGMLEKTFSGVMPLTETDDSLDTIKSFPAWYLTMGDSDVF